MSEPLTVGFLGNMAGGVHPMPSELLSSMTYQAVLPCHASASFLLQLFQCP